jgi:hypothetical protein
MQVITLAHKKIAHLVNENVQRGQITKLPEFGNGLDVLESRRVDRDCFSVDGMRRRATAAKFRAILNVIEPSMRVLAWYSRDVVQVTNISELLCISEMTSLMMSIDC